MSYQRMSFGRALKLTFSASLFGVAGYVFYSQVLSCVSVEAVLGGSIFRIEAPIEGYVSAEHVALGQVVPKSAPLAQIENPFDDISSLAEAREQLASAHAQVEALEMARAMRADLKSRAHATSNVAMTSSTEDLERRLEYARGALTALSDRRQQLTVAVDRATALSRDGLVSLDRLTDLRAKQLEADAQAQRAASELESTRITLSENKSLYDTYARRRTDQLTEAVSDISASMTSARAHESALQARVQTLTDRVRERSHARIQSPVHGRVWQLGATAAHYVRKGEVLITLASCEHPLVAALVTSYDFERITIGMKATFKDADRVKHPARVIQKVGFVDAADSSIIAPGVMPNQLNPLRKLLAVVLEISEEDTAASEHCDIGTTGVVRFQAPFTIP